jgi:hypothetical protein
MLSASNVVVTGLHEQYTRNTLHQTKQVWLRTNMLLEK